MKSAVQRGRSLTAGVALQGEPGVDGSDGAPGADGAKVSLGQREPTLTGERVSFTGDGGTDGLLLLVSTSGRGWDPRSPRHQRDCGYSGRFASFKRPLCFSL